MSDGFGERGETWGEKCRMGESDEFRRALGLVDVVRGVGGIDTCVRWDGGRLERGRRFGMEQWDWYVPEVCDGITCTL